MKCNPDEVEVSKVVELKVYMHCRACERSVFNSLRSVKGVETISTDMDMDRVTVKGHVDPTKILKRLRNKTGKRAEIVVSEDGGEKGAPGVVDGDAEASGPDQRERGRANTLDSDENSLMFYLDMLSDENPNACSIS